MNFFQHQDTPLARLESLVFIAMDDLDTNAVIPHYKLTTHATNRQGGAKTSIWLLRPWGDL